jgi:hypothetical protein
MSPAAVDDAYIAEHQQKDYQDYADNPVELRLKQFYIILLIVCFQEFRRALARKVIQNSKIYSLITRPQKSQVIVSIPRSTGLLSVPPQEGHITGADLTFATADSSTAKARSLSSSRLFAWLICACHSVQL